MSPKFSFKPIAVLCALLVLVACAGSQEAETSDAARDPSPAHFIKLSRGACFGACPTFDLTLQGDGRLTFNGVRFTKLSGQHSSRTSVGTFLEAIETLKAHDFESFADRYDVTTCKMAATDHPSVEIEVRTDDMAKSVYWYTGCRGIEDRVRLERLVDDLERVLNVANFVGTDAERAEMRRN